MPLGMLALWHLFTEVYRLGLTGRYQTALNKLYYEDRWYPRISCLSAVRLQDVRSSRI